MNASLNQDLTVLAGNLFKLCHQPLEIAGWERKQEPILRPILGLVICAVLPRRGKASSLSPARSNRASKRSLVYSAELYHRLQFAPAVQERLCDLQISGNRCSGCSPLSALRCYRSLCKSLHHFPNCSDLRCVFGEIVLSGVSPPIPAAFRVEEVVS